jgi:hypothetical protein
VEEDWERSCDWGRGDEVKGRRREFSIVGVFEVRVRDEVVRSTREIRARREAMTEMVACAQGGRRRIAFGEDCLRLERGRNVLDDSFFACLEFREPGGQGGARTVGG